MNSFLRRESRSAVAVMEAPRPKPRNPPQYRSYKHIQEFIGKQQAACLRDALRGEEGEYFDKMLTELDELIKNMPHTYQQEKTPIDEQIVYLHYFKGSCDVFITEKDKGDVDEPGQHQAFGYTDLGYSAELGYISIVELLENNVELDLYFEPKTVGELKKAGKIKES